jgi:leader peptidase (prepilin peptidase)/N-methyltransferase
VNAGWAIGGAVAGLAIGALLRGPVFRLSVASGDPVRHACARCGADLASWLSPRCGRCRGWLGTPGTLELAAAAVLALVLGRFAGQPVAAAFGFLATLGIALGAIDIAAHRLPDRLTLPAYPVLIVLLGAAALVSHQGSHLGRALLGGAALGAAFLVLALLRPGQLGGGDVKLAGLAGLALGWLGWHTLILGAALSFVLCAVISLALLATRRLSLGSSICFGPFLLGGAILALVAAG